MPKQSHPFESVNLADPNHASQAIVHCLNRLSAAERAIEALEAKLSRATQASAPAVAAPSGQAAPSDPTPDGAAVSPPFPPSDPVTVAGDESGQPGQ